MKNSNLVLVNARSAKSASLVNFINNLGEMETRIVDKGAEKTINCRQLIQVKPCPPCLFQKALSDLDRVKRIPGDFAKPEKTQVNQFNSLGGWIDTRGGLKGMVL